MDKATAEKITARGETAIRELMSILEVDQIQVHCNSDEIDTIKRGIGLSIGRIDIDLLKVIYQQYPELDPIDRTP